MRMLIKAIAAAGLAWGAGTGAADGQLLRNESAKCADLALAPDLRAAACTVAYGLATDDTDKAALLWRRSDARLRTGDHRGAIADADAAAQMLPDHADVLNAQCWTRAVAYRELEFAREACNRSLAVRETPGAFDSRGLLGLREARWREAFEDYSEAFHRNPLMTGSLYGRGLAALALGLTAEGRADIARSGSAAAEFAGYGLTPEVMMAKAAIEAQIVKDAAQALATND